MVETPQEFEVYEGGRKVFYQILSDGRKVVKSEIFVGNTHSRRVYYINDNNQVF